MFEEARSLHAFIDGCESSADAAINANVRQAAGLQRLHELALLKELQAEPQTLLSAAAAAPANQNNSRHSGTFKVISHNMTIAAFGGTHTGRT
jgi:hypothetical protein